MSTPLPPKVIGAVLIGVALAGAVAISLFPSPASSPPPARSSERAGTPGTTGSLFPAREAASSAPDSAALPLPPVRDTVASPLDSATTQSAPASCVMRVKEMLRDAARDSSAVEIRTVTGVRPEAGRGPDSLLVEGTAHGRDATAAVWHCAVISNGAGGIGKLTAVVEDGWPGLPAAFDAAHAVTQAAEQSCLEETKLVFPEYVFRGVHAFRDVDTLHVTGDAIPLNDGDRAGHFHCRALVRAGRVLSTRAKAE